MSNEKRSFDVEVFGGSFWFLGWLFTIGFADLELLQAIVALLLWPYFLGEALR